MRQETTTRPGAGGTQITFKSYGSFFTQQELLDGVHTLMKMYALTEVEDYKRALKTVIDERKTETAHVDVTKNEENY